MYQLYFAGGESTIIEEHYTLLEEVIKRGYAHKIELRYNSNGVEMPDRLFELWSHFKRVRFHYSVDSIEEMNRYIRFPADWDNTVKQFHLLDNTEDKVEVTVACAVQALKSGGEPGPPQFIPCALIIDVKGPLSKWPQIVAASRRNYIGVRGSVHKKYDEEYVSFIRW